MYITRTQGTETSKYLEEQRPTELLYPWMDFSIYGYGSFRNFLSSGERNGSSPNLMIYFIGGCKMTMSHFGVRKVIKYFVSRSSWEATPQRVIVLYTKTNYLFYRYS